MSIRRFVDTQASCILCGHHDGSISHAAACPRLSRAYDKQALFRYHTHTLQDRHADTYGYQDYQKAFLEIGCTLDSEVTHQRDIKMVLNYQGQQILTLIRPDIGEAFADLRHRLLCGEIIHVSGKNWQLKKKTKKHKSLKFIKLRRG